MFNENNNKVHLITFYTSKKPALDLSEEESFFRENISGIFDTYTAYNPETIDN